MHLCFALVCCRPGTACQLPQYKITPGKEKTVTSKNKAAYKNPVTLHDCFFPWPCLPWNPCKPSKRPTICFPLIPCINTLAIKKPV